MLRWYAIFVRTRSGPCGLGASLSGAGPHTLWAMLASRPSESSWPAHSARQQGKAESEHREKGKQGKAEGIRAGHRARHRQQRKAAGQGSRAAGQGSSAAAQQQRSGMSKSIPIGMSKSVPALPLETDPLL